MYCYEEKRQCTLYEYELEMQFFATKFQTWKRSFMLKYVTFWCYGSSQ